MLHSPLLSSHLLHPPPHLLRGLPAGERPRVDVVLPRLPWPARAELDAGAALTNVASAVRNCE